MSVWMIQLGGASASLEHLVSNGVAVVAAVTKDGDQFWLQSSSLDGMPDAVTALGEAERLVGFLNAMLKYASNYFEPVFVAGTRQTGESPSGVSSGSRSVPASVALIGELRPLPNAPDQWFQLAAKDDAVSAAIHHFGLEHNWINLNKVLDDVRCDLDRTGKRAPFDRLQNAGLATVAELEDFYNTANDAVLLGDAARHGGTPIRVAKNPLPLTEAQRLITDILSRWIEAKLVGRLS